MHKTVVEFEIVINAIWETVYVTRSLDDNSRRWYASSEAVWNADMMV